MSSKINNTDVNTIDKTIDKVFCQSPEYFKAMATTHRFMRDVLMKDGNTIINTSKNAMDNLISTYKDEPVLLYSIIRLAVVTAMNIDIQYFDINGKEINMHSKLYTYLGNELPNSIPMINTVYKLYNIVIPKTIETPVAIETPVTKKESNINVAIPEITSRRSRINNMPQRPPRAHGGNIKTL